jgi:hypothetical protein
VADEHDIQTVEALQVDLHGVRQPLLHRREWFDRPTDRRRGDDADRLDAAIVVRLHQRVDDAAHTRGVVFVPDVDGAATDAEEQHSLAAAGAGDVGGTQVAVRDEVLRRLLLAGAALAHIARRIERDVDPAQVRGVGGIVREVRIEVRELRRVRGVGVVEAVVAVDVQAGELREGGARRLGQSARIAGERGQHEGRDRRGDDGPHTLTVARPGRAADGASVPFPRPNHGPARYACRREVP